MSAPRLYIDGRWLVRKAGRAPDGGDLATLAASLSPPPCRTYWYDAVAPEEMGIDQAWLWQLGAAPGVMLRLGELVVREPSQGMRHAFRRALDVTAAAMDVDPDVLARELSLRWQLATRLEQKQVDTLLVMDLIAARETTYLAAGDTDFLPAVDNVRARGHKVILVLPGDTRVARPLYRRADGVVRFDVETWRCTTS